jgi:Domain of unknown function (DUF4145)
MAGDFALDTAEGLSSAIRAADVLRSSGTENVTMNNFVSGSIYCGRCRGLRRVLISSSAKFDSKGYHYEHIEQIFSVSIWGTPAPALFTYSCIQCDAVWSVLIYPSVDDIRMALLPAHFTAGGVASEHAPPGVAFYLDQAGRCHYIGANSAAIAMFRSALEWLLADQGFTDRMVGPKLAALERAIEEGTAPKWTNEIEPEYLQVIKDLGNIAAHTNAGDLSRQEMLDAQLYRKVELTFLELLEVIYEREARRKQRLAELRVATDPKWAKESKSC